MTTKVTRSSKTTTGPPTGPTSTNLLASQHINDSICGFKDPELGNYFKCIDVSTKEVLTLDLPGGDRHYGNVHCAIVPKDTPNDDKYVRQARVIIDLKQHKVDLEDKETQAQFYIKFLAANQASHHPVIGCLTNLVDAFHVVALRWNEEKKRAELTQYIPYADINPPVDLKDLTQTQIGYLSICCWLLSCSPDPNFVYRETDYAVAPTSQDRDVNNNSSKPETTKTPFFDINKMRPYLNTVPRTVPISGQAKAGDALAATRCDSFNLENAEKAYALVMSDNVCAKCGNQNPKFRCSCHNEIYCSRECQLFHWTTHKLTCTVKPKKNKK